MQAYLRRKHELLHSIARETHMHRETEAARVREDTATAMKTSWVGDLFAAMQAVMQVIQGLTPRALADGIEKIRAALPPETP